MPKHLLILIVPLMALIMGCSDKHEPDGGGDKAAAGHTVLVYMIANNNLGSRHYDEADINEMVDGAKAGALGAKDRLLVYHAPYQEIPELKSIDSNGRITTLKTYGDDGLSSAHGARMAKVIADARAIAPANSMGLVLWSHGDGWLQNGITDNYAGAPKRAFGSDNGRKMNITVLAKVLGNTGPFDFLYFDCCLMGNVETIYELRHTAPYIVASAIELPNDGMPYHQNLSLLFKADHQSLVGAARNTFNHYNALSDDDRTCGIAVYKTAALDALASATAAVYAKSQSPWPKDYSPQLLDTTSPYYYYDMADYVKALCAENGIDATAWQTAFDDCVTYQEHTPMLWNSVSLSCLNGLSTFIVTTKDDFYLKNYNTLEWSQAVTAKLPL